MLRGEQALAHAQFCKPAPPRFIEEDKGFERAWSQRKLTQRRFYWVVPKIAGAQGASAAWDVLPLTTPAALAQWLQIELRHLDWFANAKEWEAVVPFGCLRHYSYRWQVGRSGKRRLLEVSKPRLEAIQRRLLHGILERVPPHAAEQATSAVVPRPPPAFRIPDKRSFSDRLAPLLPFRACFARPCSVSHGWLSPRSGAPIDRVVHKRRSCRSPGRPAG
jgi:hypothetical protein